jgi:hypothetical protein
MADPAPVLPGSGIPKRFGSPADPERRLRPAFLLPHAPAECARVRPARSVLAQLLGQ